MVRNRVIHCAPWLGRSSRSCSSDVIDRPSCWRVANACCSVPRLTVDSRCPCIGIPLTVSLCA
eukprot:903286-Alexandrium_andersonii.AAC.1